MPDNLDQDIIDAFDELEVTQQARTRYKQTESYQAQLANIYYRNHFYYAPPDNDQWPEDKRLRPGRIHITQNIIKPAVDTEARLEGLLPRVTNVPDSPDGREKAESAEKMILRFLELSGRYGWDVWLPDACKVKGVYGKMILKPFWNKNGKRPDVSVIENPANLRLGWGSSDFSVLDWGIYEYTLSPLEAMRRWPDIEIHVGQGMDRKLEVLRKADHADPIETLDAVDNAKIAKPMPSEVSDYQERHVRVWDYWFKDENGTVRNAMFVEGVLVGSITAHPEYPDIPYIVIEHDHEPGSPEGVSTVEPLIDIQVEFNRALSHFAQLVADEIDPAWYIDADSVPPGLVPHGGEILAAGEGRKIQAIEKPVNQFPIQQLITELYKGFHFTSGLSEILFSLSPGAQTAGRALAVQIEASANRIDPRRRRLYQGLSELIDFWIYMVQRVNPKVDGRPVRDLFKGLGRWKFIAPELTPRDVVENTTNVINKVQAKLVSLEDAMDELGVDAPIEMKMKIEAERTNPKLFPGDTQAYVAVMQLLQQLQMQMQQMQQMQQPAPGGPGAAEEAQGQQMAEAQSAQPTLDQEFNQSGPPQPATGPGSPPPLGNQTLIRNNPTTGGATALQQIAIRPGGR